MIPPCRRIEQGAVMTTRRLWFPVLMAALVSTLVAGSSPPVAKAADPTAPAAEGSAIPRAAGTLTLTSQGTAWVPEVRTRFSRWRQVGWGTQAKVKAAGVGDQWVHIQVPGAPFVNGYVTGIYSAQFCASSSNGAQTRPVQIDMWNGSTRFYSAPITWWADNAEHCWVVDFSPARFTVTVGISVLLHFANTTDQITLGWASASFLYG
jgi:hypothetical protein